MIFTTIWAVLIVALFSLAAYVEWDAIAKRINGANGFIFLSAGLLALASVPIGFVLIWLETRFATAFVHTLAMGAGGALLWYGLLRWLDRCGRSKAERR